MLVTPVPNPPPFWWAPCDTQESAHVEAVTPIPYRYQVEWKDVGVHVTARPNASVVIR